MKTLKRILLILVILVLVAGGFVAGILTGFRYGELSNLPFVAGGEWSIGIYTGQTPFKLSPAEGISNPVLVPDDVTDMPARQLADPFMVRENNTWYMFFEVVHARTNQGNLGYAVSEDGLHWQYQKIVIDEPFHMSYPCVFKWQGGYYMIPETNEANAVLLYKAEAFPSKWQRDRQLIDRGGVDPTFFVHNDTCWMFLGSRNRASLMLYYAPDLLGPWTEHPMSPLIDGDRNTAGPAGRVLSYDGKLYRFAMDCDPDYGNAVRVFEINELTSAAYRETEIPESPILSGTGEGWNARRMHQVDAYQIENGSWLVCVDGWDKVLQVGLKY